MAATINYIYAELFYAKWKERNEVNELPAQFNQLQSAYNARLSELDEADATINDLRSALVERDAAINQLQRHKQKVEQDLTCPHCKAVQESYGTLQAHKGYCDKNPNGRKKSNGFNGD